MVRSQLREFVTERIVGENFGWDDEAFPTDVYDDMTDLGLLGLHLSEEAGGEGFDPVTAGVVYEELGRGDVGLEMIARSENLVNKLLWEYGDENHRDVAKNVRAGEEHICFGLTEPGQGSDAQNIETMAEPTDDGWVLSGEKTAITGATLADYCFVIAHQSDPDAIRAYLLPLDADGVDVQPYAGMGCEVSGWGQIFMDDVEIPAAARVADENAFKMAMRTLRSVACLDRSLRTGCGPADTRRDGDVSHRTRGDGKAAGGLRGATV